MGDAWVNQIRAATDIMVNDYTNASLMHCTDETDAKALGEMMLLEQGLQELRRQQEAGLAPSMIKAVYKLTGRYTLNSEFDYATYDNTNNVFKYASVGAAAASKPGYAYTSFFKIHETHVQTYWDTMLSMISELQQMVATNVPTTLFDDVETRLAVSLPDVVYVPTLGVTQRVSTFDTPDRTI